MASYTFKSSMIEMSVKDFYLHYKDSLPKLIMITQGYCGEVVLDTFDREQIFRIHTYSIQKRVVAKMSEGCRLPGVEGTQLSIPVNYDAKFCVIKSGSKVGKEEKLQDILDKHKFPVEVQFGKSGTDTVKVGDVERSTGYISGQAFRMVLLDTYEEYFLLGNAVAGTSLYGKVTAVPIYLPDLRLALITGFEALPQEKFDAVCLMMTEQVEKNIKFDKSYGNEDIAVYSGQTTGQDIYSYVSPVEYCHIDESMTKGRRNTKRTEYDMLQLDEVGGNVYDIIPHDHKIHAVTTPADIYDKPVETKSEKLPPPPVKPKPKSAKPVQQLPESEESDSSEPPPRPARPGNYSLARRSRVGQDQVPEVTPVQEPQNPIQQTPSAQLPAPTPCTESKVEKIDVSALSVEELAEWMVKLKMEKYTADFQDKLIDGAILLDLDNSILKEEFGMLGFEAIKLMKFAKEGHVPKSRGAT